VLEATLLLLAAAALPEAPVHAPTPPSAELLEFLADWPVEPPAPAAVPVPRPAAAVRRDQPRPDHD
jgi:hypothetical protein